jgi:hypothetical protein
MFVNRNIYYIRCWSRDHRQEIDVQYIVYRLIHEHFHIGLVIIPRPPYWPETESWANMGRGMITRPIWKCPCIKLFITYFRHLEKRHPYWPETKLRPEPIWASIWKWSCSNPITGYFPGVWKYGQFTSGHIGHTKMPLFELSTNVCNKVIYSNSIRYIQYNQRQYSVINHCDRW